MAAPEAVVSSNKGELGLGARARIRNSHLLT